MGRGRLHIRHRPAQTHFFAPFLSSLTTMTPRPIETHRSDPILTNCDDAQSQHTAPATTSATGSPSSPSNPNTPALHNGHPLALEVDPVIVTAMRNYDDPQRALESSEFPNPYDDLPLVTFPHSAHARTYSAPDLGGYVDHTSQQSQRRPSILRPAHPKSFNSVGSQRASLTLSGFEFGLSPPSSEDLRLGNHSLSLDSGEVVRDRRQSAMQCKRLFNPCINLLPLDPFSLTGQPHPLAINAIGIEEESDIEPHVEVSERLEDLPHELKITGFPDESRIEEQLDMPPTTEQTYDPSNKSSGWKFWSRSR